MVLLRQNCCPHCSSNNVEPRARPDYRDERALVLRAVGLLLGCIGAALLLALGTVPDQQELWVYGGFAHLGAAACCGAGAHYRLRVRSHARCRQCGCLWRR